jgi:hypothetical protein
VPVDDDVLHLGVLRVEWDSPSHLEDVDGVLGHAHACEAVVKEHVADVSEHDGLVGREIESHDLLKAAVRAADPQDLRLRFPETGVPSCPA